MKINESKSIGSVIYIVEGDIDEANILSTIYTKLGYSVITYDKNKDIIHLINDSNKYSRVFIIPAEFSAISRFDIEEEYYDHIFTKLRIYNLDYDNSAVYFIFDRDRISNRPSKIIKNMSIFSNSRDNGDLKNGLFLMSYPCIESIYLNFINDKNEFKNGKSIKEYVADKKEIKANNLVDAFCAIKDVIEEAIQENFRVDMLDDFKTYNCNIFEYEEKYYKDNKLYRTLSLIILSFLDLGIIDE